MSGHCVIGKNPRRTNMYKAPHPALWCRLCQDRGGKRSYCPEDLARFLRCFLRKGIFHCKISGNFSPRENCKSYSEICPYLQRNEGLYSTANLAATTLLISTVKDKQWAPYWVRELETQAVLMAAWTSPGNFPLCHSSSPSLLGHVSRMPQERGQEKEGTDLEDPQGSSKQKNFLVSHFQDLKEKYCFCSFPRAFPQYFPPPCDGEFMGSLSCWAKRDAPRERALGQGRCLDWGKTAAVKRGHD